MKKIACLLLTAAMLLSIAAAAGIARAESAGSEFPLEFTTYMDMTVTIDHVPERVIAANTNTADQLYAMGLQDKIIGVCAKNSAIYPAYQEMYDAAPVIAEKAATLEQNLILSMAAALHSAKRTAPPTMFSPATALPPCPPSKATSWARM